MASLGREINLNPPLTLGQLPDTSEELMKLDQVFNKSPDTRQITSDTRHQTLDLKGAYEAWSGVHQVRAQGGCDLREGGAVH